MLLSEAAASLPALSGLPRVIRALIARGRVGIVLYHDPEPVSFERHLAYLSRRYRLVPFEALARALESNDWSEVAGAGRPSLVIHVDDGYVENRLLLDSLVRYGIRPTFYLCSHIVGTRRRFWSQLDHGRSKRLRLLDNRTLLDKLRDEAGFSPEREYPERQALSAAEVCELSRHADMQSHGRYHFSLLTLADEVLEEELSASRREIARLTGKPCQHFSYPYGDHGPREIEAVRRAGYRTARSTRPGWNGPGADPYRLRIVADVPGDCSINRLRAELTGLPRLIKYLGYRLVTRHLHAIRTQLLARRRVFD